MFTHFCLFCMVSRPKTTCRQLFSPAGSILASLEHSFLSKKCSFCKQKQHLFVFLAVQNITQNPPKSIQKPARRIKNYVSLRKSSVQAKQIGSQQGKTAAGRHFWVAPLGYLTKGRAQAKQLCSQQGKTVA